MPHASSFVVRHPRKSFESNATPTSGTAIVARWHASTRFARASVRTSPRGRCAPVSTTGLSSAARRKASALAVYAIVSVP